MLIIAGCGGHYKPIGTFVEAIVTTIKLTFAAATLLIVAWVMYTIQDMIPGFATGAAELLSLVVRSCMGTVIVVIAAILIYFWQRQRHEANRQRDGAFPLREYHLEPWTKRLWNLLTGKPSPKVILDANAMMTHAAVIYQGVHLAEPPAGWDRQLAYLNDLERTRRVQAAIAGDAVLGNPLVNLPRGIGGVANAATGRMLAGAYDKVIKPQSFIDAQPEPARLAPPELTGIDAVAQSRPAAIVMGQTDAGELVRWNMAQTQHLRFHGATQGSGKTNAIQTVAAGALATGAHVVVCDRVQFKDWSDFDGRAEFVDTSDPQQLAGACARLYNIYLGRTEQLRAARVKNIAQHGGMQRIVVIIGEFGAQMASARADGVGRDVEYPLTQLARLAGSTGIHLVAEDQVVRKQYWPPELVANLIPVIGKMPAYAGQMCGYQGRGGGTDTFPSYTFWYEGVLFQTPHMEPALPSIMAQVPPPQALVMLTPAAVIPDEDGDRSTVPSVPGGVEGGGYTPVPPLENAGTERNAGTPAVDDGGRWDDVVAAWFSANPQALTGQAKGISDLARAMCRDNEGGSDANYEAYKGRAHALFHDYRNGGKTA